MKNTLLTIFIFLGTFVHGQINITSADMPVAGDTLRYSVATPNATFLSSYQNTGANYVWNFSYLQPISQDLEEYNLSSQTAYSFNNSIARLFADTLGMGGLEFTDVYEFRQMDSSSVKMIGRGITYGGLGFPFPVSIPYIDTGLIYQFPLSYNDYDSNTFVAEYDNFILGVFYQASGYRINHVDGYGQITTPYGTFNCLRVITDIVETDTVHYDTINFKMDTHIREYKWLAKGEKYPILQVTGAVVSGVFAPSIVTYRDSVRNLIIGFEEQEIGNHLSIYPNPNSGEQFSIKMRNTGNALFDMDLLDISGRLIRSYSSKFANKNNGTYTFNLPSNIHNGIYFIKLNNEGEGFMEKLIINKKQH